MLRKIFRSRERQRGQGLLEFALVLPILLMLIMGTIDFGRMVFLYSQVSNGAREGARYGSVSGVDKTPPQYLDCAGIRDRVSRIFGLPLAPDQIIIQYDNGRDLLFGGAQCSSSIRDADISVGDRVRVTVKAQLEFLTPVVRPIATTMPVEFTSARTIIKGGTFVPVSGN